MPCARGSGGFDRRQRIVTFAVAGSISTSAMWQPFGNVAPKRPLKSMLSGWVDWCACCAIRSRSEIVAPAVVPAGPLVVALRERDALGRNAKNGSHQWFPAFDQFFGGLHQDAAERRQRARTGGEVAFQLRCGFGGGSQVDTLDRHAQHAADDLRKRGGVPLSVRLGGCVQQNVALWREADLHVVGRQEAGVGRFDVARHADATQAPVPLRLLHVELAKPAQSAAPIARCWAAAKSPQSYTVLLASL